jgi:geranylgeranyl pyrophosphate synthase
VPQPKAVREQIRNTAVQLVAGLNKMRPLTRDDIEQLARRVTAKLELRESYLGWTMVILASTFWAAQVRRVPINRRLLLLPLSLDHSSGCNVEFGRMASRSPGCAACTFADLKRDAETLGYRVLPAEGASVVLQAIVNGEVDAILGVASLNILEKALDKILISGIPCMAVPLTSGESQKPSIDDDWVAELIRLPYEPANLQTATYIHLMRTAAGLLHKGELQRLAPPLYQQAADRSSRPRNLPELNGHSFKELSPLAATEQIAFDFLTKGGKYSRPFITLATYDALTGAHGTGPQGAEYLSDLSDSIKRCALSIEVFHKASLVHDDVEDDDEFRYGDQTLHRRFGTSTAINVGDYLIGLGYRLVSRDRHCLGGDAVADILDRIADAHMRLSQGQGAELIWRDSGNKHLTPEEALRIYELKTSPAFEAALYTGMRLAGPVDSFLEIINEFSRSLGVAFQIINDLNDWLGDDHNKLSPAGDILGGRPTVLWALAIRGLPANERSRLQALAAMRPLTAQLLSEIRGLYEKAGVFQKADELVEMYQERAKAIVARVDHAELRSLLEYLIAMVLMRYTGGTTSASP